MIIIDPDNNVTLDDLHTIDDLDDAENILEQAIVTITTQLADDQRVNADPDWAFSAHHALKAKKFALRSVQRKRGSLKREYQTNWRDQFISQVRHQDPKLFDNIMSKVGPHVV